MHLNLRRPRDAVRRKRPEIWTANRWFLLHDNAPAHRSVLAKYFVAKNSMTKLERPPYSSDLDPADFYLFSRIKSALKWWRSSDATDIITKPKEELKMLLQNGLQEFFDNFSVSGRGVYLHKRIILKEN